MFLEFCTVKNKFVLKSVDTLSSDMTACSMLTVAVGGENTLRFISGGEMCH